MSHGLVLHIRLISSHKVFAYVCNAEGTATLQVTKRNHSFGTGFPLLASEQYANSFFAFMLIQGTFFYCTDEEKKYEVECR